MCRITIATVAFCAFHKVTEGSGSLFKKDPDIINVQFLLFQQMAFPR